MPELYLKRGFNGAPIPNPKLTDVERLRLRIQQDPEWFFTKRLGSKPYDKQIELAKAVFQHRRVAVRGCVSSGKTAAAGMTALSWLFAFAPNSRVFTLAPSYRQVDVNLWGEIPRLHAMADKNKTPLGGKMLETTHYKLGRDWYALGFSTKEPHMLHGIHGPNDLLIVDDAHGVPQALFDEIENMMAGGNTHILLLYNPVTLVGETFNCTHKAKALYHNMKISFWDLPQAQGKEAVPGTLTIQTVKAWELKYGKNSNFYRSKVDAEYPNQQPDTLIPMDWIELATKREVPKSDEAAVFGMDVAREGDDETVLTTIIGRQVLEMEVLLEASTMASADCLDARLVQRIASSAFVDVIGIGAGVVDREVQRGRNVTPVNVAQDAIGHWDGKVAKEHFFNLRAQIAFIAREAFRPDNPDAIAIPNDQELIAQLSAITWKINSDDDRVRIIPKKEMKKVLGYSPDRADSLFLALFGQWLRRNAQGLEKWAAEQVGPPAPLSDAFGDGEGSSEGVAIEGSETLAGLGAFNE